MIVRDDNYKNNEGKVKNNLNSVLGAGKCLIISGILLYLALSFINVYFLPSLIFPIISDKVNLIIGCGMLLIGFFLFSRVLPWLIRIKKNGQLYTSGPFRIVRHPLYAIILLIFIPAITILLKLIFVLICLPSFLIIFHIAVRSEEKELLEKFGDDYKEYMKKTKRIIPKIY